MVELDSLDELSRNFAERLLQDFADWSQYAAPLPREDGAELAAFEMTVPQPRGERVLYISTDEDEITVGFGMWHEHFGSYLGISDAEAIEQALETIRGIVAERNVVRVAYRDGKWVGSNLDDAADKIAPAGQGEATTIYSWYGTYDRSL